MSTTWRIIPVNKWLVTPIYKSFRPFGRGTTLLRGQKLTMVINHLVTGMLIQVGAMGPCSFFSMWLWLNHDELQNSWMEMVRIC